MSYISHHVQSLEEHIRNIENIVQKIQVSTAELCRIVEYIRSINTFLDPTETIEKLNQALTVYFTHETMLCRYYSTISNNPPTMYHQILIHPSVVHHIELKQNSSILHQRTKKRSHHLLEDRTSKRRRTLDYNRNIVVNETSNLSQEQISLQQFPTMFPTLTTYQDMNPMNSITITQNLPLITPMVDRQTIPSMQSIPRMQTMSTMSDTSVVSDTLSIDPVVQYLRDD